MRNSMTELKELRLHHGQCLGRTGLSRNSVDGFIEMAAGTSASAGTCGRAVRSVNHQMNMANSLRTVILAGSLTSALPALMPGWSAIYPA